MSISVGSTTDSKEAVMAAMGDLASQKPVENKKEVSTQNAESKPDETKDESVKDETELEEKEAPENEEKENEAEELEESEDETKDESKPKKKGGFQKKLEKAEKLRASLEQEKEYWRNEALRTKTTETKVEETKPDLSKRPKADDFKSHDEYVEALTDWKLESKLLAKEQKQKEDAVKSEVQTKISKHQERVTKFSDDHEDWDDVIEVVAKQPLSITVQEAIINSELGPDLMYELAKDPKELKRICGLTPIQAAMALGKIEARLTKSDSPKETKLTTKAPAPVTPVRTRSGSATKSIHDENLTFREYENLRAKAKQRTL